MSRNEFAVTGARVFDGDRVLPETSVLVTGTRITAVGDPVPPGSTWSTAAAPPCCPA